MCLVLLVIFVIPPPLQKRKKSQNEHQKKKINKNQGQKINQNLTFKKKNLKLNKQPRSLLNIGAKQKLIIINKLCKKKIKRNQQNISHVLTEPLPNPKPQFFFFSKRMCFPTVFTNETLFFLNIEIVFKKKNYQIYPYQPKAIEYA